MKIKKKKFIIVLVIAFLIYVIMQIPSYILAYKIHKAILDKESCVVVPSELEKYDFSVYENSIVVIPEEFWRSNLEYYFNTFSIIVLKGEDPDECTIKARVIPKFSCFGINKGTAWIYYYYEILDKNNEVMHRYGNVTTEISFERNGFDWKITDILVRP